MMNGSCWELHVDQIVLEIEKMDGLDVQILIKKLQAFYAEGTNISWAKSLYCLNFQDRAEDFFNGKDSALARFG